LADAWGPSRDCVTGGGYLAARYPEMRGELGMLLAGICGFWFGTKSSNGAPK
jgi:hypothetical protein